MEPVNVSDPTLWDTLFKIFGAGGIPLLLLAAGEAWAIKYVLGLMAQKDQRLKEKDDECRAEREKAREYTRADTKEAFGQVAELTKQVTLLAERAATAMNARTREN